MFVTRILRYTIYIFQYYLRFHLTAVGLEHITRKKGAHPGPYLGILRPWAQENFAHTPPPPLICSYSVTCKQKQHKKLTKYKTL
jgi:hypothetical protein